MEPHKKRRKVDSDCRKLKDDWTKKYFFVQSKGKAMCLVCREFVAVLKEFRRKCIYSCFS